MDPYIFPSYVIIICSTFAFTLANFLIASDSDSESKSEFSGGVKRTLYFLCVLPLLSSIFALFSSHTISSIIKIYLSCNISNQFCRTTALIMLLITYIGFLIVYIYTIARIPDINKMGMIVKAIRRPKKKPA